MRRLRAHLSGAAALVLCLPAVLAAPVAGTSGALIELPGATLSAVTVDLDDDRAPEVVRLVEASRGSVRLEAWAVGSGEWRLADSVALGPTLASEDRQPALLAWQRDGRMAVALLEPRTMRVATAEPCCLGMAEVQLADGALASRALPMPITSAGDAVQVVDLDADGTDELVIVEFVGGDRLLDPRHAVHVLRLLDGRWQSAWRSHEPVTALEIVAGDADGRPGDELYLGPDREGRLLRLSGRDGRIVEESTSVPLRAEPWSEVVGILDGAVLVRAPDDLVAVRWPSDEEGTIEARARPRGLGGVAVVGEGADARVVTSRGYQTPSQGAIGLLDARLQSSGRFGEAPAAGLIWDLVLAHAAPLFSLDRSIFPYIGPIPVSLDGSPGFLANGALARAGASGVQVSRASPLLGYGPVGLAGPDGAWMVLRDDPSAPDAGAVLAAPPTDRADRLVLLPTVDVLATPETEIGPMLTFDAAIREPTHEARAAVRAAATGFDVDVAAPPGSLVAVVGQRFDAHVMDDEPWRLHIEPPPRMTGARGDPGSGDRPFRRWVLVVLPDGTAVAERWDGVFVEDPPLIEVEASPADAAGRADIVGRTEVGNRVRIDGAEVPVTGDGGFATTAAIELLPRTLPVEVEDPFGMLTRGAVTVPGVLDPGRIPWVPAVVAATLVAAIVMFLRVPAGRPAPISPEDGDGRLEEIDAD